MSEQALANGNGAGQQPVTITREMLEARLDEILFPVINAAFMGCKVTMMGPPPEMMLYAIARVAGKVMGLQFGMADQLGEVLKARKQCVEQFEAGVRSVKPQMRPQSNAPMTAVPPRS